MVENEGTLRTPGRDGRRSLSGHTDTSVLGGDLPVRRGSERLRETRLLGGHRTRHTLLHARRHLLPMVLRHHQVT